MFVVHGYLILLKFPHAATFAHWCPRDLPPCMVSQCMFRGGPKVVQGVAYPWRLPTPEFEIFFRSSSIWYLCQPWANIMPTPGPQQFNFQTMNLLNIHRSCPGESDFQGCTSRRFYRLYICSSALYSRCGIKQAVLILQSGCCVVVFLRVKTSQILSDRIWICIRIFRIQIVGYR